MPYRSNSLYEAQSLKRFAIDTAERHSAGDPPEYTSESSVLWDRVKDLWAAVGRGRPRWGVPAYNGGLFAEDPSVSPAGAALADLRLTDDEFGPALAWLLLDDGTEGIGPVDFRSLSVREFGTIYEGLLESRLAVAADDLTVKATGRGEQYVPAGPGDESPCACRRGVHRERLRAAQSDRLVLHQTLLCRASARRIPRTRTANTRRASQHAALRRRRSRRSGSVLRLPMRRHRYGIRPFSRRCA